MLVLFIEKNKVRFFIYLIILAVCSLLYWPGIFSKMYADDFVWVFDNPSQKLFFHFLNNDANINWYRPVVCSFYAFSQAIWGLNTGFIHLLQIFSHAFLCIIVFELLRKLNLKDSAIFFSICILLTNQSLVAAINGNDTLSQVFSVVFGFTSSVFLYFYFIRERKKVFFVFSVLFLGIALFSKENSVIYFVVNFFIILYFTKPNGIQGIKNIVTLYMPFVLITLTYLILRFAISNIQPSFGDDIYQFRIGTNIIKNVALFLFALINPVSSAATFSALKTHNYLVLISVVILSGFTILILCYYCKSILKSVFLWVMIGALLFSLFPMLMLNKVSELYVYSAIPVFAVIGGLAFSYSWNHFNGRFSRIVYSLFLVLFFGANIFSVNSKIELMKNNGERASIILPQVLHFAPNVPKNGTLFLLNENNNSPEYSSFTMNGFNVLNTGLKIINQLSKRDDLKVEIITTDKIKNIDTTKSIILVLDGTMVKKL